MPTRESRRQRRKYIRANTENKRLVIIKRFPELYDSFKKDKLLHDSISEFIKVKINHIDDWVYI